MRAYTEKNLSAAFMKLQDETADYSFRAEICPETKTSSLVGLQDLLVTLRDALVSLQAIEASDHSYHLHASIATHRTRLLDIIDMVEKVDCLQKTFGILRTVSIFFYN
jgi:hypothetical protein